MGIPSPKGEGRPNVPSCHIPRRSFRRPPALTESRGPGRPSGTFPSGGHRPSPSQLAPSSGNQNMAADPHAFFGCTLEFQLFAVPGRPIWSAHPARDANGHDGQPVAGPFSPRFDAFIRHIQWAEPAVLAPPQPCPHPAGMDHPKLTRPTRHVAGRCRG